MPEKALFLTFQIIIPPSTFTLHHHYHLTIYIHSSSSTHDLHSLFYSSFLSHFKS